jgi:hypothetical protein|tara:strand:- start:188 stop:769 length:582 start_codon:yes stop_codon:yes gene_type:complete
MIKKNKYLQFLKSFTLFAVFSILLTSCGLYKKSDARKVSPNPQERVKSNMEKGEGFRIKNLGKDKSGNFQFASSNAMWRASIDILDFAPFSNVDYSGGLIITDWFSNSSEPNNSLKITIRFLTNEIRADGLQVILHKKTCQQNSNCSVKKYSSNLNSEIKLAILKEATRISKMDQDKYMEENGKVRINDNPKF